MVAFHLTFAYKAIAWFAKDVD